MALQLLLNDECKRMGAEPGRTFLRQPAAKLEPVIVASKISWCISKCLIEGQ